MSAVHHDAFARIRMEHEEVVRLLTDEARNSRGEPTHRKDPSTGAPLSTSELYETAVATANEAYALLLIAIAEGIHAGLPRFARRTG